MKNIILVAPPAAGKGTLSKQLSDNLGYIVINWRYAKRSIKIKFTLQEGNEIWETYSDKQIFYLEEKKIFRAVLTY